MHIPVVRPHARTHVTGVLAPSMQEKHVHTPVDQPQARSLVVDLLALMMLEERTCTSQSFSRMRARVSADDA